MNNYWNEIVIVIVIVIEIEIEFFYYNNQVLFYSKEWKKERNK